MKVVERESKEGRNHALQAQLQKQVCDLEYKSRRLNLDLQRVPVANGENLVSVFIQVAGNLEVPHLSEQDIISIHRLPTRQDKIPGTFVRLTRQSIKYRWMSKRSKLKDAQSRIFIQENLIHIAGNS